MKRTKVHVEKETKKAYLISNDDGQTGWIQKRWLAADGTVATKTFERAIENYNQRQADYAEAKAFASEYHAILAVVKETDKAIAVDVTLDFCDVERTVHKLLWIPKSLVKARAVQGWFVTKKLREMLDEYRMDFSRYGSVLIDSVSVEGYDDAYATI